MPVDDDTTVVAMAAAAATVTHLQVMQQGLALVFDDKDKLGPVGLGVDDDDLGAATAAAAEKSGATLSGEEEGEGEGDLLLQFEDDDDDESKEEEEEKADPRPTKHTRLCHPRPDYGASVWGVMLETMRSLHQARQLHPACVIAEGFRRRFRVPYEFFLLLVEVVKPWFGNVTRDVAKRDCVPVTLKVLGVLHVLGRGSNSFADIQQMSLMSRQTAEKAFRDFCEHFPANLYDAWVHLPTGEDLVEVENKFRERGYPGAVGSTSCMRVARGRCPPADARTHTGKEGFPSWKYGVTVDLDGRILASTKGNPGGLSEKAVVRGDVSVLRVRDESPWATLKFFLCEDDGREVEHVGGWLVASGECDRWNVLLSPIKPPSDENELRWSERLEDIREDAERLLAKLRGRFRHLKTRVQCSNPRRVDNLWMTCCILHNMLLKFDGLEALEVGMDWAGADGVPEIGTEPTLTKEGGGEGGGGEVAESDPGFEGFRAKLVEHLAYKLNRGEVA